MKGTTKVTSEGRRTLFPTAMAYFATLPDGWASFPSCLARTALLGGLRGRGALDDLGALPSELQPLVAHLATETEWLPEVVHVATLLAIRDARFSDSAHADDDFLAWMAQLNRDLLGGPMLADELGASGPDALVPRLPELWQLFHRGTPSALREHATGRVQLAFTHPRQLFPPLALETHRRTLALSLAKAGAVAPHVLLRTEAGGDTVTTVFEATWQ